jgi:hypothetical protein
VADGEFIGRNLTVFADIEEANQFIFDLDGSCGYDYGWDILSFQIEVAYRSG